jgi:hypothetical protein
VSNEQKNEVGFTAQHGPSDTQQDQPPRDPNRQLSEFEIIADEIGKLVTEKNEAYGSAYIKTAQFLLLLFPNGIHIHRYRDMLLMVRILDKLMRLATRPDAFGESPYRDISGYGILGVHSDSRFEGKRPVHSTPDVGEKV